MGHSIQELERRSAGADGISLTVSGVSRGTLNGLEQRGTASCRHEQADRQRVLHVDTLRRRGRARVCSSSVSAMNLKPGLHRTGALDVVTTRRQAEHVGFTVFVLPETGVVDRASFFDAVRATLPLDPPILGSRSWDALSDSLWEGLHTHPAKRIVIVWPGTGDIADSATAEFELALNVLADVASSLADPQATRDGPKEVAVLVE